MQHLFRKTNQQLIKKSFIAGSLISIAVYGWIRILFYEFQFTITEEVMIAVKVILSGGLMATAMVAFFLLVEFIAAVLQGSNKLIAKPCNETGAIVVMENGMLLNLNEEIISPEIKIIVLEQQPTVNAC